MLTEIDPDDHDHDHDHDHAFGLCDLGLGYPELGWVSLAERSCITDASYSLCLPIDCYVLQLDFDPMEH